MKTPIVVILIALACYTLAGLLNGKIPGMNIAPLAAAIYAGVGAFGALAVSHGMK